MPAGEVRAPDITGLLDQIAAGRAQAAADLLPAVYAELERA